ncbi:hypothetical protein AMS68_002618 [Peltaster fructicola]|uniref:Spc7 kinetochore protein domain-containing protein n=1 Tax=Peltaster fructicola TaxID=286661 RepID=A0A6H0XR20_9PEZI|nr:hypothetical protein AMS68_002618 [Peltaster fructicola]
MDDKENTAPLQLGHVGYNLSLSPVKDARKSRSKSIGPGGLNTTPEAQRAFLDRGLNATVRGILPDKEDAERKAARRKSMANRRVSFAPEATLHTWDVIEYMKDHTTSTQDQDATRNTTPGFTVPDAHDSPSSQLNSDDDVSMSGMSEDSGESASGEEEDNSEGEDDDTGTSMSLVTDGDTTQGSAMTANSSTSSSLDRNLRMAAEMAGTRGIEYDEYGDMSMEMVGEEVTNAFQPWAEQVDDERRGSAAFDQENMNPFVSHKLAPISETAAEDEDMSMDVTRAVGGILSANSMQMQSSPFAEVPMDLTQAIGGIQSPHSQLRTSLKRDHTDMDDTQLAAVSPSTRSKRRRSLTRSPAVVTARHPLDSGVGDNNDTERWDETMEFTRAIGGINAATRFSDISFDGNEELSMELTTVLGGIRGQHAVQSPRQALPNPSSPFRIEVDPTMTHAVEQDQLAAAEIGAQSPTPRAKATLSERRSSARSRRSSAADVHGAVQSSPSQRRVSRRISARSFAERSPVAQSAQESQPEPSTPVSAPRSRSKTQTPQSQRRTRSASKSPRPKAHSPISEPPPQDITPKQQMSEHAADTTPIAPTTEQRSIFDTIKLMITPRKESLKAVTPKKAAASPSRRPRSALKSAQRQQVVPAQTAVHTLNDDVAQLAVQDERKAHIHLQQFLDEAGIRFMDLTTSKRRLTTATTPSRLRKMTDVHDEPGDMTITLDDAIVAAACTEPELELFKHACHELKRYIDEGRIDIKALEAETFENTPLLIQAYMAADKDERTTIDAHMRDIKTNARLRSKEMWYGWRSNLVDDLMKALQTIAEDLIADDELLRQKEDLLSNALPPLLEQRTQKQGQAEQLLAMADKTRPEEQEELQAARERLQSIDTVLEERRRLVTELQDQLDAQNKRHAELDETRDECLKTIQSLDSAKASNAAVSEEQVAKLEGALLKLEDDYEWSIKSASVDPCVVTMSYKTQLELFFHPLAFHKVSNQQPTANAPIGLKCISKEPLCTIQRFFVQLLQAHLHSIVQQSTQIADMLTLVASTWDIALQLIETERLLAIEGPVEIRIQNDECLIIDSTLLLPAVRTKLRASFKVQIAFEDSQCETLHEPAVVVVYGQAYNEKSMSEFLRSHTESGFESWSSAVQQLRRKLVQQGPKSSPS